jgi:hypothetical protein
VVVDVAPPPPAAEAATEAVAATAAAAGAASPAVLAGPLGVSLTELGSLTTRLSKPLGRPPPGHPRKATSVPTTTSRSSDDAISTPVVPRLAMYARFGLTGWISP